MKPSKYQEDIFCHVITTNKNIAVKATAGSGKTTTIVQAAGRIPYGKKALFVAFNKSIVNELRERLPDGVECNTMHSMGCKAIFAFYQDYSGDGKNKIDDKKQINFILIEMFSHLKVTEPKHYVF
jgi:superfamily II DNA or RNA helicase